MALTLALRLYYSLMPWSTQRQGELELTSVKMSEVHPFGNQGLASTLKMQRSFP